MIHFTCPSCSGKCQVGDELSGRKLKCPKCGTRIRHHADGNIELLTVGAPPPPPAASGAAPPPPPAVTESSAVLAVVPDLANKLLSQGEAKQNTIVVWGLIGFIAVVLGAVGLLLDSPIFAVTPTALALVGAFVWLSLRAKQRQAAKTRKDESAKTEKIAKL